MEASGEGISSVKPRLDYKEVKARGIQFRNTHEWSPPGPERVKDTMGVFSEVLQIPLDQIPTLTEIPEEFREDVKKEPVLGNVQRYSPEKLKQIKAEVVDYEGKPHSRVAIFAVRDDGDIAARFYNQEDGKIFPLGGNHDLNSGEFVDNLLSPR